MYQIEELLKKFIEYAIITLAILTQCALYVDILVPVCVASYYISVWLYVVGVSAAILTLLFLFFKKLQAITITTFWLAGFFCMSYLLFRSFFLVHAFYKVDFEIFGVRVGSVGDVLIAAWHTLANGDVMYFFDIILAMTLSVIFCVGAYKLSERKFRREVSSR